MHIMMSVIIRTTQCWPLYARWPLLAARVCVPVGHYIQCSNLSQSAADWPTSGCHQFPLLEGALLREHETETRQRRSINHQIHQKQTMYSCRIPMAHIKSSKQVIHRDKVIGASSRSWGWSQICMKFSETQCHFPGKLTRGFSSLTSHNNTWPQVCKMATVPL